MATDSEEWKLICLGRWVVRQYDATGIAALLHRWEKEHGKASRDKVREYVKRAWNERR